MLGIIIQLTLKRNYFCEFFEVFEFGSTRLENLVSKIPLQRNFEIFYGMFIIIKHHNKKNLEDYTSAR